MGGEYSLEKLKEEKEAYYFSHDSNARYDPDILDLRSVYGAEGYGWFWILVEMMRDQAEHKLKIKSESKYAFNAFASEMGCEPEKAKEFIEDCIHEFHLFVSDGTHFWSESLLRRMLKKQGKSESARRSANARWNKKNAQECETNANASKTGAIKESKVNEIKEKKLSYATFVNMTESQYNKLVAQYGPVLTSEMVSVLDNYKGSNGKAYKDDYRAILSWVVEKVQERHKGKSGGKNNELQDKNQLALQKIKEAEARERSLSTEIVPRDPEYV
jgi:hypothetical protein